MFILLNQDEIFKYMTYLKAKNDALKEENEKLKSKVKRLQDIATRTEAEKEEYADLYCKCENELIKNSRRCDNFMTYKRFIVPKEKDDERFYITDTGLGLDTVSDEMYSFGDEEDFCRLFDKLNEQQAIITELNDELEKSSAFIIEQREEIKKLHYQIIELQDKLGMSEKVMKND